MSDRLSALDGCIVAGMDVLADVIAVTRLGGTRLDQLVAAAPWAVRLPDTPTAAFHAVARGTCWLSVPGQLAVQLVPGDVALVPTGAGHVIASDLDATPRPYHDLIAERPHQPTSVGGRLELPGAGALTHLLCGGYTYQHDGAHPVLSLLPPLVHLPATAAGSAHHTTLQMLAAELDHDQPGTQTVADRLVDVLFVHILRAWAAHDDGRVHWLRALRDPHTARAMSAMHLNPAKLWTVADLARVAGLSRATFARRFTDLVGEPPLTYLTRWRMDLAARRLRTVDQPVAAVGRSVGYTSEFAFSRAFSRHRGTPPANYRARHTDQALENIGTESSAKNELGHGAEVGAGSFRPKTSPS